MTTHSRSPCGSWAVCGAKDVLFDDGVGTTCLACTAGVWLADESEDVRVAAFGAINSLRKLLAEEVGDASVWTAVAKEFMKK